jgi:hypothetical protein
MHVYARMSKQDELCVAFLNGNNLLLFGACSVCHLLLLSSIDHFIKAEAKTTMVDSALDCTSACFWGVCCYNRFSTFWPLIPKPFSLCLTQDIPNSQQTV